MKKILLSLVAIFVFAKSNFSQNDTNLVLLSPGGFQDTVFDKDGKKFLLRDLQINPEPGLLSRAPAITTSCNAGYFNLFYAANSGFDQISNPIHIARRDLLCKLYTDISNLINSPLSAITNTNNYRVNILIDDAAPVIASSPAFLAGASSMYAIASNPSSPNPGIADCEVWKTIISGKDSYINVASPLNVVNGAGNFYHGRMIFNFANYTWNLNTSSATMTNQLDHDLYSVALHEATHLLGFGSLINFGGVSTMGANNNYFARYDKFLNTASGIPLLGTPSPFCYNYNTPFNVSPSLLAPASCTSSGMNISNCATAIRYIGTPNVAVFTPSCYASGSSFSHFEDMCTVPPTFTTSCVTTPPNNDLYYVMSNAGGAGDCYIKRYLKQEERDVLCDLGYSVNAVYNASVNTTYPATVTAAADYTYLSPCSTDMPVGINDGLVLGNYIYNSATSTLTFAINTIIGNDFNTSLFSCPEAVYNNGVVSVSGNTLTFVANPGVSGVILLRYLPVSPSGIKGNITYIYGFIKPANCNPPNACNIVQNGGFESITGSHCGEINSSNTQINCWSNTGIGTTPDLFTNTSGPCVGYPTGNYFQLGVSTYFFAPPVNSHNAPNPINTKVIGVTAVALSVETMKNYLSSPLIPNQTYVLNCWLYSGSKPNTINFNPGAFPAVLEFATAQNYGSTFPGSTFPGPLNSIAGFTVTQVNTWIPYTYTFTFASPGSQHHNVLYFGINFQKSNSLGFPNSPPNSPYIFIDDISILPLSQSPTVTIPSTVSCSSSNITNLGQYAQPPGGVFSGPGVTFNGSTYDFNSASTLTPGTYGITYSYTNTGTGCNTNLSVPVTILPYSGPTPTFTLPSVMCLLANSIPDMSVTVSPTIIATTGSFSGPGIYIVPLTPPIYGLGLNATVPTGIQTYTYSNLSCGINLTASTNILPSFSVNIINSAAQGCINPGQTATLTAIPNQTGAVSYTWLPGNYTTSSVTLSPSSTTAYTVTANNGSCDAVTLFTIFVTPSVAINFTNPPTFWCVNQSIFYLENYLAAGTPTGGTWSGYGGIYNLTGSLTSVYVNPTTLPGTYTITYNYNTPNTPCSFSNSFTVNIGGFNLLTNNFVTYCSNLGIGALISATATPSAGVSYSWMPGNLVGATQSVTPASSTIYTVIASIGQCTAANIVSVNVSTTCCTAANYFTSNVLSAGTYSGSWAVNNDITLNGNVNFLGEFVCAPNVSITVSPGANLQVAGAHLYSCGNMWHGIVVQNGGKLRISKQSLIEDAKIAVTIENYTAISTPTTAPNFIEFVASTFNRNYYGILIKNYNQAAFSVPFTIQACLFTCRSIPFTTGAAAAWPATSPALNGILSTAGCGFLPAINSPYCLNNYAVANLKAPYSTSPSYAGVFIENSGITSSPTATNALYYSITVGDEFNTSTFNLFDNLMHGIYSKNSNVQSFNNIFQNSRRFSFNVIKPKPIGGYGIYAVNDGSYGGNGNNYLNITASTPSLQTLTNNKFYNCHFGIGAYNIFELNAQYGDFKSTQVNGVPVTQLSIGQFAIHTHGNRFKNYQIKNNKIQNINTGVYLYMYPGPLNIPSLPSYGQYLGFVNIQKNFFSPTVGTTGGLGTKYINYGVYAVSALTSSQYSYFEPNAQLRIQQNDFSRVQRGIYVSGFQIPKFNVFSAANSINLAPDVVPQFGINHNNNWGCVANTNTITGTGTMATNTLIAGVYSAFNNTASVQCNSVSVVGQCFEFYNLNPGTIWLGNKMQTARRGLFLNTNGQIGQQGSLSGAFDNQWLGSWVGTNYGTWTESSVANVSKLYVRSIPTYTPPNNWGLPASSSYSQSVGAINFAATGLGNFYCGGGSGGGCLTCGAGARIDYLNALAMDSLPFVDNVAETQEIAEHNLFRNLEEETTLAASSNTLQTFYTASILTPRQKLYAIEKELMAGNLNLVSSLLSAFTPTTNVESNYKLFYDLQKKYTANNDLTLLENVQLYVLAHKCPAIDGTVVYQARNLYSLVNEKVTTYNDYYCAQLGFSFGRIKSDTTDKLLTNVNEINNRNWLIDIYPNPAQEEITISTINEQENLIITIYDVQGKLLLNKEVTTDKRYAKIKLDLKNGMYFVTLMNEKKQSVIKKLIIAK